MPYTKSHTTRKWFWTHCIIGTSCILLSGPTNPDSNKYPLTAGETNNCGAEDIRILYLMNVSKYSNLPTTTLHFYELKMIENIQQKIGQEI